MAGSCPAPGPDDPLVQGLLTVVDCNVQTLVRGGYSVLFQQNSPFAPVLTVMLIIYVASLGYNLMLGRAQLRVTDLAMTAVKLGAVVALATQWGAYQAVVYDFLFSGPQEIAGAMLTAIQPDDSAFRGDVFDGLQKAFDSLNQFAASFAQRAPPQASPLVGGPGFAAFALTSSAGLLLLSSLGVLLVAKIVLGLLLAVGPIFIAMMLFDSTRGVFEGWLRASLAFAFAPLATTLVLAISLTLLEPPLLQLAAMGEQNAVNLGPVYALMLLVMVLAGVSLGAIIAGGMLAAGFRLPPEREGEANREGQTQIVTAAAAASLPRAARTAAAAAALERRDSGVLIQQIGSGGVDRRTLISSTATSTARESAPDVRLGQAPRRRAQPRQLRAGGRTQR